VCVLGAKQLHWDRDFYEAKENLLHSPSLFGSSTHCLELGVCFLLLSVSFCPSVSLGWSVTGCCGRRLQRGSGLSADRRSGRTHRASLARTDSDGTGEGGGTVPVDRRCSFLKASPAACVSGRGLCQGGPSRARRGRDPLGRRRGSGRGGCLAAGPAGPSSAGCGCACCGYKTFERCARRGREQTPCF
jgi:hypothetical protein